MAVNPISEDLPTVTVPKKSNRGGARPGAGRPRSHERDRLTAGSSRTMHYLYIIHETERPDICKIGIAQNPYKRLMGLQIGTWRRLRLAAVFEVMGVEVWISEYYNFPLTSLWLKSR